MIAKTETNRLGKDQIEKLASLFARALYRVTLERKVVRKDYDSNRVATPINLQR